MFGRRQKVEIDARQTLLETAARLFAEHGFEAVSTRMLAKEAAVNIAMIAYYFGSKEKLYEAIIDERLPKTRELLQGFLESDLEPWAKFCAVIDAYIEKIFSNNAFAKLIYRELSLQQRPVHSEQILNGIMANWEIMYKIIEEGQQKGVFRTDIDKTMTLASTFGSIIQLVNTPCIAVKAMKLTDEKDVFSEETRMRLKAHLYQMLKSHLLVNPQATI
jgi:AcrR family transcriptional regulator